MNSLPFSCEVLRILYFSISRPLCFSLRRPLGLTRQLLIVALLSLVGCQPRTPTNADIEAALREQKEAFSIVVDRIEAYHQSRGTYPKDLQSIDVEVPTVALPRTFNTLLAPPVQYEVARDHSFFRLTYSIHDTANYELHSTSSYSSLDRKWVVSRHLDRLPHLESSHFGNRFQSDRRAVNLLFTLASLVDATRLRSAYPCRNLWADWVERALGSGVALPTSLPELPLAGELKVYLTKEPQSVYVVVLAQKVFSPMTKPLSYVSGIYKHHDGESNWTTVQTCDASPG